MTLQSSVKTLLAADSDLTTLFTGGILTFAELAEGGLTRKSSPDSFDANLRLLPTLIVKERQRNATSAIKDEDEQWSSFVQALEVWYYAAGDGDFGDFEDAQRTVYGLLHDRTANNCRLMRREKHTQERDRTLSNAIVCYDVYDAVGIERP